MRDLLVSVFVSLYFVCLCVCGGGSPTHYDVWLNVYCFPKAL